MLLVQPITVRHFSDPGCPWAYSASPALATLRWRYGAQLDWQLTQEPDHAGLQRWMKDLNHAYRDSPALHQQDFSAAGFQWIDGNDYDNSVLTFLRWPEEGPPVLVAANFTPVVREGYRVGVPLGGRWREVLNSDAPVYGGSGQGNMGGVDAEESPWHGRSHSVCLRLPPLGIVVFRPEHAE